MAKLGSINLTLRDNIVRIKVSNDLPYKLKDLVFFHYFARELTNKKPYLILSDIRKFHVTPTNEVLLLMANSKWINKQKIAEAILIESLPNLITARFYIKHLAPQTPTKIFRSEKKAIRWLETMRKQNN